MEYIPSDQTPFECASHEDPRKPGVLRRVIADRTKLQFGQVQMVNWARLPAGSSFRSHYHEDMQEVFVLISGNVAIRCGSQEVLMRPGDTVIVAPREIHRMTNMAAEDAEYLVFGISSQQNGRTIVVDED